ncbi:MAG: ComEC/Rec2 family competence protein [bacterium]|nr:ComEC/Rec2 family competence protein [bacterium]
MPIDKGVYRSMYLFGSGAVCSGNTNVYIDNIVKKGIYYIDGVIREANPYFHSMNVYYKITPQNLKKIKEYENYREVIAKKFSQLYGEYSLIVNGIALGIKPKEDPNIDKFFKNSGLYHILVASGQNIAFIWAFIAIFLFIFRFKVIYYIVGLLLTFIYAYIIGFEPPILRAFIMSTLTLVAYLSKREALALNILFLTGFIILVIDPNSIYDISFILSFLATLGIILTLERFKFVTIHKLRFVLIPLFVSIGAILLIAPILINTFNYVVLLAPISNVFAVVPSALVLYTSFLSIFLPILSHVVFISAKILYWIAYFFSEVLNSVVYVPSQPTHRIFLYYLLITAFLLRFHKKYFLSILFVFVLSFFVPNKKSLVIINSQKNRYPVLIDKKILIGDLNSDIERILLKQGVKIIYHIVPKGASVFKPKYIKLVDSIDGYEIKNYGRSIYIKGSYSFVWGYGENIPHKVDFYFLRNRSVKILDEINAKYIILKEHVYVPQTKFYILKDIKRQFLELKA